MPKILKRKEKRFFHCIKWVPRQRLLFLLFIRLLKDSDPRMLASAARILGKMGSKAAPAVPVLIETLKDCKGMMIRQAVAESLARTGPQAKQALPILRQLIHQERGPVKIFFAYAILSISSKKESQAEAFFRKVI
ncbi:MAG: HEAT repeat domain-containing protein [Planctomycetota bacterium]|nr:MAG: HEAT repeat domain-containing protein [Planctomycetota bacterium]